MVKSTDSLRRIVARGGPFTSYQLPVRIFMRKPFVAGNWKMNTDSHSSVGLAESIVSGSFGSA